MSTIVSFKNVQKTYDGENLVVKNLNLDIRRGEFLTMLGPSGSGKTTCLMMLAGFETATHGEILLNEKPINRIPPEKRNIGMVFQSYALFPHMTVAENLAYPLKVRRQSSSEIERRVKRALAMVNMSNFEGRRPGQMSGGQQQRIAVARALVFEPDLVLMDEPLGALDKQLREQMQYEIKKIHEESGISVVYVTHDQSEAMTMSDRIAVFNNGVIQQLASPADLYERPENAFVARFIGENNELKGHVLTRSGSQCLVDIGGSQTVRAVAGEGAQVGKQTSVSLRPERVSIGEKARACDNVFHARVDDIVYYGDHIRLIMSFAEHRSFIVKVPNDGGGRVLRIGETVDIGWMAEGCRALQ